jgi:cysteine-rich repeat protein
MKAFVIASLGTLLLAAGCGSVNPNTDTCGNGHVDSGEVCDDGNTEDGDGCSAVCDSDETCGNNVVDPGEVCDDGNTDDGDACAADCSSENPCGNGQPDPGEACDDGNNDDGDGCSADCSSDESCGNTIVDPGESCDDGNTADEGICNSTCTGQFRQFDGTNGGTWTLAATEPSNFSMNGFMTYNDGSSELYTIRNWATDWVSITAATGAFVEKTDPTISDTAWATAAPDSGYLYIMRQGSVSRYNVATDVWDSAGSFTDTQDQESMTESDGNDHLYVIADNNMVVWTISTGAVSYYPLTFTPAPNIYESRLGYDPGTNSIYFGGYGAPQLYRFDIATQVITQLTSIPENQLNDIFCSDRSGHLYAAGDSTGVTMFTYDIATDTWSQIPDFIEASHGNDGGCAVSAADGNLYVTTGETPTVYRLALN